MNNNDAIEITVRRAEERDIPRIEELLADICLIHCEGRPDIFKPGRKYGADALINLIINPERIVLVACDVDHIVGYAICIIKRYENHSVFHDFTELYIDDICVDSDSRGQGIGHKLFDEIKRYAKALGAYHIDLNVWAFNKGAIKFYENLGMKPMNIKMELILDD